MISTNKTQSPYTEAWILHAIKFIENSYTKTKLYLIGMISMCILLNLLINKLKFEDKTNWQTNIR